MAKTIALFLADAHVRADKPDTYYSFEQVVSAAIEAEVEMVVGCGDLLDKQTNRASPIVFLAEQLRRLERSGVLLHYIEGQHEVDLVPWMSAYANAVHFHKREVEIGPYTAYGLSWQPAVKLQEELAAVPEGVDLLVCHQVWSDWMGELTHPEGAFSDVPGHVKVLVTGDLHQWKREKAQNAAGEELLVVSPGALCAQKIDEPHTNYYVLMDEDGKFTRKPLKGRVFLSSDVLATPDDLDKFVAGLEADLAAAEQKGAAMDLPQELMRPYLWVHHSAKLTDCVRRVERAAGGRALLYWKPIVPEEKQQASLKAAKLVKGQAVTPLTLLKEEVDPEADPAVYELCNLMLAAPDRKAAFQKWRSEVLDDSP